MNFQVLMPPLADNILHVGASGYGFLMAASGLGSTVAALCIAFSGRSSPLPIVLGAIALGLGSIVVALSTRSRCRCSRWSSSARADRDGRDREHDDPAVGAGPPPGRVMSLYTTVFAGSVPAAAS
jgi:hypothetical protein